MLAGAVEPAARMMQSMAADEGIGDCRIVGHHSKRAWDWQLSPMAWPHTRSTTTTCASCRSPRAVRWCHRYLLRASSYARPAALLDAYVVGFELECRLGNVMNPRHYHQRGWHCTSSIGTLGAAAAAARVLGLDAHAVQHALGIAASSACGLKENIGSMVKPLHAGMAARNGVMAARLAQRGFTSSPHAIDGAQGYLAAMDSERATLDIAVADLGIRWRSFRRV